MQPPPPPGNLSWFSSLNWQKSNRTKKCVYAGDIDLNWLSRDMLLLAHGKGQAKSGGGTVVESRNRRIFLSWCLQSVIFSIMCDFLLSWADGFIGLLCGQEDAGRGWTSFAAKRIQRGAVLVWNLLQLLTLLTFCIWQHPDYSILLDLIYWEKRKTNAWKLSKLGNLVNICKLKYTKVKMSSRICLQVLFGFQVNSSAWVFVIFFFLRKKKKEKRLL